MKKNIRILIGRFRHWSLKYKILTIVLFNSVTMLLGAVFGYRLYTNAYNKLLFDSMASRLSVTSAQISQKMENAEYISNLILGSSSIQDCLSDLPSPEDAPAITEYNRTINNALTEYATLFQWHCLCSCLQQKRGICELYQLGHVKADTRFFVRCSNTERL